MSRLTTCWHLTGAGNTISSESVLLQRGTPFYHQHHLQDTHLRYPSPITSIWPRYSHWSFNFPSERPEVQFRLRMDLAHFPGKELLHTPSICGWPSDQWYSDWLMERNQRTYLTVSFLGVQSFLEKGTNVQMWGQVPWIHILLRDVSPWEQKANRLLAPTPGQTWKEKSWSSLGQQDIAGSGFLGFQN